ncbi:MAG: hypothetical protein HY660_14275 [Armatimonadetes bacterium]|nr:hypothetical protein [Armatimonadota bacterium]
MPRMFLWGLLVLLGLVARVQAASPPAAELHVRAGFAGLARPGAWLPLAVTLNVSADLDGIVSVEVREGGRLEGPAVTRYIRKVHARPGVAAHLALAVPYPDPRWPLVVRALRDEVEVARTEVIPTRGEMLVLVVVREQAGHGPLAELPGVRVAYLEEDGLPRSWAEYEGVSWLVLRDLSPRRLDPAQRRAVEQWVALGGRVLLAVGEGGGLAVQALPEALRPVATTGRTVQVGGATLAGRFGGQITSPLPAAQANLSGAATAAVSEAGVPLIVERRHGWGRVVAWTFDDRDPVLARWTGRSRLWRDLLASGPHRPVAGPEITSIIPTSHPIPARLHLQAGLWLLIYIAGARVAGRLLRRGPAWWVLFGAGLALATWGFGMVAWQVRAGTMALVEMTLVEAAPGGDAARATAFLRVLAPYGQAFRLRAAGGVLAIRPLGPTSGTVIEGGSDAVQVSGAAVRGAAHPTLEASGVISAPARGVSRETPDALTVVIERRADAAVGEAFVYFRGQVQRLATVPPGQSTHRLDPGRWASPDDAMADPLRRWVFSRLRADAIIEQDVPWLIGTLDDSRLITKIEGGASSVRAQVLLVPLPTR